MRVAIDEFPRKHAKRSPLSTATHQSVNVLDWISARHFPFTVKDVMGELELADTSVRKHLQTLVVCGWIVRCKNRGNGANAEKTYRSNVRIRRINASASAS